MLLDHFAGDLEKYRDWHGFHQAWAIMLAKDLNRRLPDGWFAEPNVQFQIQIDVARFDVRGEASQSAVTGADPALIPVTWSPPAPTAVIEVPAWNDVVAVEIYAPDRPRNLVGAIELVSPSNKDRPESRESFVAKCERYLQTGVGLIVIDVVTERRADLHGLLLDRFDPETVPEAASGLFVCSYQPRRVGDRLRLQMWHQQLAVGQALPELPLSLRDGPIIAVELNATYLEACRSLRIPNSGLK